jgi:HAE1 family hydrophobic/amphiphilic exporter-1
MAYNVEKVQPYQTEASKREQVEAMFNRIAPNYDKLNRLLSLGIDNYWRRESIGALKPYHPRLILDVATGTGDFAILANEILDPERIVGIDISDGMMAVGREKVKRKGMEQTITFEQQDSAALSFPEASFDAVTAAFGVRNFENIDKSFGEILRVLKPGGVFLFLELTTPEKTPMKELFSLYSKYVMTLSGLALGAGMLIDNVIVVIESIFRNREQGLERREAIINGTTEVAGAVIASTVTTIVVFIPIVYLHGASGELFKDLAWTVTFALLSSLFVALMVIPVLYDRLTGRENDRGETESVQFRKYSDYLRKFLGYRWWVIGGSAALLIISILLIPFVGTEFLPRTEGRDFTISVKLPEGTRLERTDAVVSNLEYLLHQISGDSLAVIYSHIGKGSSDNAVFEGEHTAMVKVILSDESQLLPAELIARFAEATASIEGLELTFKQDNHSLGTFLGEAEAPIVVEVKGEDLEEIAFLTEDVLLRMASVEGIYNVRSSMADGAPELNININRTMAGIHNISANTLVQQLEQQLQGHDVGKIDYKGEMRDIVIKVPDITRRELGELVIRNGNQEFRLNEIATITHSQAPKEIYRRNQNRINKIVADMDAGRSLDKMAREISTAVADIGLSPGYSITVTGEEEKRAESMQSLLFALMLSVVLVYMVLASQYESLLHPFTILLTTPFGLVGALLFFLITRTPLNVMGAMGIIMLAGIAINNSILLVGRINQLKRTVGLTEAIVQAGQQRIRPIIMTTLTTILVLLPMTFDFGEGAAMRSSMAVAVIGGLVTSTLMSLVVIPCVYYLFEQMKERVKKLRSN